MNPVLLPFAMFVVVLPFPGTVALRLLLLAVCGGIALWQWWRVAGARAAIPCQPALAAWIVVCLASLAYSRDAAYSLGELKNELGYSMMAFAAFFVAARDRERALQLLRAVAVGLAVIGAWAAAVWLTHGFVWQEDGRHGGVGVFATYLVTVMPALVWLAVAERSAAGRRIAAGLALFALFLAFIVGQRAAWPVLAVQAVVALVLAQRAGGVRIAPGRLAAAIALFAAIALAGVLYGQATRYGETSDDGVQLTTDMRLGFWPGVVARIVERPLAGAGFGRGMMRKADPDLIPAGRPALWHAHNVVLNYGLQMGVPGMAALLLLFAAFGVFFWPAAAGPAAAAGIAGLTLVLGVLLRNQFNDFFVRDMSLLFWALTGIFARLVTAARQGNSSDQQTPA